MCFICLKLSRTGQKVLGIISEAWHAKEINTKLESWVASYHIMVPPPSGRYFWNDYKVAEIWKVLVQSCTFMGGFQLGSPKSPTKFLWAPDLIWIITAWAFFIKIPIYWEKMLYAKQDWTMKNSLNSLRPFCISMFLPGDPGGPWGPISPNVPGSPLFPGAPGLPCSETSLGRTGGSPGEPGGPWNPES